MNTFGKKCEEKMKNMYDFVGELRGKAKRWKTSRWFLSDGRLPEECLNLLLESAEAIEECLKEIQKYREKTKPLDHMHVYGYSVRDLILFASMCERNNVRESDLKEAACNLELAVRAVETERIEVLEQGINTFTAVVKTKVDMEKLEGFIKDKTGERK